MGLYVAIMLYVVIRAKKPLSILKEPTALHRVLRHSRRLFLSRHFVTIQKISLCHYTAVKNSARFPVIATRPPVYHTQI